MKSHSVVCYIICQFFLTTFQLKDAILNFAEGLRVIGVKPDEKIALFADNSCRWLVADQGVQNFVNLLPKVLFGVVAIFQFLLIFKCQF